MNLKVDAYIANAKNWQAETKKLRSILLGCGLTEEFKWDKPCYTFQESNLIAIAGFKRHCALLMFKGALLKDPRGILIVPGGNTHAGRQIRFTSLGEITALEPVLKAYVLEAIEAEKAGLKVDRSKRAAVILAEELQQKLDANPALNAAFNALTPGRRRAYNIFVSAAKQSKTREARVEKWIPHILSGKGMDDR